MSPTQAVSAHSESKDTIELKIPPKDIKRLDDPHDDNRYAYECQVPVTEASKLVIGRANPRKQDLEKPLSRDILKSLKTAPDLFHLKNRGIWVAARRAEYDNQTQVLTLHCPQAAEERYGVVDGGHTKKIIEEFLLPTEDPNDRSKIVPFVMLHIRVGVEDNMEDMVVCLNRSTQLKEYSLNDYKGEFEEIRKIFSAEPFAEDVGYIENEDREYDVLDVIQRLTLFCTAIYPNAADSHPTIAYSSKAKCLDQFIAKKKDYLALEPIMASCFRLADQIEALLPEASGSEKFGRYNFAKRQKPRLSASLKGLPPIDGVSDWKTTYSVSEAVIYPLAASLRVLVRTKSDGTVIGWRQDPVKFFAKHGGELFKIVKRYYDEKGKSISALGKDADFWARLHKAAYVALHPED